jgi:HAD superfamily hydrolase (TIGR01459 family)
MTSSISRITDRFSTLSAAYDVVLCDIWGVVHNGLERWPEACDALARFRSGGGTVVLITNAPRPREKVVRMLHRLHVPPEVYDDIVTSGDVTRAVVTSRLADPVFHLGPERDRSIFDGLPVHLAPAEEAAYVVCSGLWDDEVETPEDYRDLLGQMRARGQFMVCANPDVVVERGHRLLYCAGALADLYAEMGGEVLYAGKPHRPIYSEALAHAATVRGAETPLERVLAIGDSLRTDVAGAAALGVDCLFVTSGIHAEELGHRDDPDMLTLSRIFAEAKLSPKAVTRRLTW